MQIKEIVIQNYHSVTRFKKSEKSLKYLPKASKCLPNSFLKTLLRMLFFPPCFNILSTRHLVLTLNKLRSILMVCYFQGKAYEL